MGGGLNLDALCFRTGDVLIIAPARNICPWLEAQRVGRSGRATIVYDLISRGALEIGCAQVQPSAQEPLFSANFPSVRLLRSKRDVAIFGKKLVERRSLEAFAIASPQTGVGWKNPDAPRPTTGDRQSVRR